MSRQDLTVQYIQYPQSLNSPLIFTLPNEILCSIFKFVCTSVPDAYHRRVTITHVCRIWRQAAINFTPLWTQIDLKETAGSLLHAELCASRADLNPLHVTIRCKFSGWDYPQRVDIVPWLRSKANNVKSLRIIQMNEGRSNDLLPVLPFFPFLQLEEFDLLGLQDISLDLATIANLLTISPSLKSLSLAGVEHLISPHFLHSCTGNITHLSIGGLSHIDYTSPLRIDAALEVIYYCNNLRVLKCFTLTDEDNAPSEKVTLHHLTSLTIGDGPETCRLLLYLVTPRLESFELVHGKILNANEEEIDMLDSPLDRENYNDDFVECFHTFHNASAPRITQLTWEGCVVGLELLESCSQYLRNLEEIEISGIQHLSNFFYPSFHLNPFPHIRSLIFVECSLDPEWLSALTSLYQTPHPEPARTYPQIIFRRCAGVSDIYLTR